MLAFVSANLATIIGTLLVVLLVVAVLAVMRHDKKTGKGSCSCGENCGGCASKGMCHPETSRK